MLLERYLAYLIDILHEARLIIEFVQGMDEAGFRRDVKTQRAVTASLEIISEATKQLTDEFRAAHPSIEWKHMAGMRDILIHRYKEVNLDTVWQVIRTRLPELTAYIEPLIPSDDEVPPHESENRK